MGRILVTDGVTRACLAATRALGRAGHEVYVVASRTPAMATVSRYCHEAATIPEWTQDPVGAANALRSLVERWGIDLVIPATDVTTLVTLRCLGNRVGQAMVAGPDRDAFEALSDKVALLERAATLGLAVPRSAVARDAEELRVAARTIGYPCILKPHRSTVMADSVVHRFGVRQLLEEKDLAPPLDPAAFPVLVQQFVPGVGEGVFLLVDGQSVLAAFAHRRLREKPPEGGVSVYREAVAPDPDLVAKSAALLASVGWRGVAMVEFRHQPGHDAIVMEVNGRLWGSLQLAIDAGVNFPTMLASLFLGQEVRPVQSYRLGVRSRWFWGDVDHVLARIRGRPRGPAARGLPGVPRLLWDFVRQFARRDDRLEVLDFDDPRPFVRETLDWFHLRPS